MYAYLSICLSLYLSWSGDNYVEGHFVSVGFLPSAFLPVSLSLSSPISNFPFRLSFHRSVMLFKKKARDKLNKNKSCSHKQTGVNVRKDLGWWALLLLLLLEADYSTSDVFWPSQAEFSTQPPVMGLKCWACVPVTSLALDANEVRWPKTTGLQSYPSCFSLFSLITFWQEKGVIRLCFFKVLLLF